MVYIELPLVDREKPTFFTKSFLKSRPRVLATRTAKTPIYFSTAFGFAFLVLFVYATEHALALNKTNASA